MTEPVQDPAADYVAELPDNPHHDEEDVPAALENDTDDGKGGAVVPKSDFESYADPNAEKEDDN